MRYGDEAPNKYDLSSLRVLGSVGEPINPEAWRWVSVADFLMKRQSVETLADVL